MKPCLTCGVPCDTSYCDEHARRAWHHEQPSAKARGYDAAWRRLSKRARRLQPFCELCGALDNLQADHLPSAWERKAEGRPIRLCDVRVLCGPCNVAAGSSRPGHDQGRRPVGCPSVTAMQAASAIDTGGVS